MSVYAIDGTILFDAESFTLRKNNDVNQKVVISSAASRCLKEMIDAGGEYVPRDDLIFSGWGSSGQIVTTNSLNQAIAQIRKALKELDVVDNFIVTVPRRGYKISRMHSVEPIILSAQHDGVWVSEVEANIIDGHETVHINENDIHQSLSDGTELPIKHSIKWRRIGAGRRKYSLFLLALVVISFTLFFYINGNIIHLLLAKKNELNYLPIATKHKNIRLFYNQDIGSHGDYTMQAISRLFSDQYLKDKVDEYGEPKYVYINGSFNSDVFSYFLCRADIIKNPESCYSYISVKEGTDES